MSAFTNFTHMLNRGNFVILDTETTGLRYPAEIIEIAVIDPDWKVLLDTRVKNTQPVPPDATAIHGIKDSDLLTAPSWADVKANLVPLLAGKDVIVYNASYDFGMLHNTDRANQLPETFYDDLAAWHCAMLWYASWYGDWDDYRQSYRWQKLTAAVQQMGLVVEGAHGALGDCKMTLSLIRAVLARMILDE